jgi:hypothetical protein
MIRSRVEGEKAYQYQRNSGEASRLSGTIRVMQRPLLGQMRRSTAAAELQRSGDARKRTM